MCFICQHKLLDTFVGATSAPIVRPCQQCMPDDLPTLQPNSYVYVSKNQDVYIDRGWNGQAVLIYVKRDSNQPILLRREFLNCGKCVLTV